MKYKTNPHEEFATIIEGREFTIAIDPDLSGRGWNATVPGMTEPGSPYQAHSMVSREEVLLQLVENIEESILTQRI